MPCVVTTREPVLDLAHLQDSTAPEWELERLSDATGADLLQRLLEPRKPKGVHQVRSTSSERVEICQAVKGHALTLRMLGGYIHRALRDVRRWREVDYAAANAQYKTNPKHPDARYGHAFTTIAAYEHWLASGGPGAARQLAVLRLLGLFDRPASGTSLAALRALPAIPHLTEPLCDLPPNEWNLTLSELEECSLVALSRSDGLHPSLDAHPLLREYFGRQLREQQPEAWRAAHRRLYEHLCATTKEGDQPTLEDLQPLYQAVAHGCQADLLLEVYDKIYNRRILRGNQYYSSKKLGLMGSNAGAVVCFFETPWSRVSPALAEADQAELLNEAAFYLRALGRLTEAVEPMRLSGEMDVDVEHWEGAAISYGNLSELELTLGDISLAVRDAEQSVIYADRSGNWVEQRDELTTLGDALHQAGRSSEAELRFREAETIQAQNELSYPLLHSLRGFRYCDLLLADPERTAWRRTLHPFFISPSSSFSSSCRSVSGRAAQTLRWMQLDSEGSLLTVALDHLTLGRTALYEAIVEESSPAPCESLLLNAVDGLRLAGRQDELPKALLTRAWQRSLTGARTGLESAQSDLDEAWEIAERGPMPLFMADIHLYRARLFGKPKARDQRPKEEEKYPWVSVEADLKEARRLIEKHGYLRRTGELEDAEAALLQRSESAG